MALGSSNALRPEVSTLSVSLRLVSASLLCAARRRLPDNPCRSNRPRMRAWASRRPSRAGTRTRTARYTLLVGYFNRNAKQTLDIPIGPNNRIEPGGPDMGQPTYLRLRRNWGVFTIKVPKDFGNTKRFTGRSSQRQDRVDSGRLDQGLSDRAVQGRGDGQRAAEDQVCENGKEFIGPPVGIARHLHRDCRTAADA